MKLTHLLTGAYAIAIAAVFTACNDKGSESTAADNAKDTNMVDTRRNTGTDTTPYLSNDSAFNKASPKTTTTE